MKFSAWANPQRQTDYPANLAGKIAIIPRGTCEFGLKSTFAGSAGAVGLILYNIDDSGPLTGGNSFGSA